MKKRFRKDYHDKSYKNPYFRNRNKEKRPRQTRLKFSSCLFVIAVIGWFIFLFFSPYFRIENINFGDTSNELGRKIKILLEAKLEEKRFIVFSNKNYFIFNTEDLRDQLGTIFLLNELRIEKRFPNTIIIKAKEKNDVLVLVTLKNAFFVDKTGLVVDIVPEGFKTYEVDTQTSATTTIDSIQVNPAKMVLSDEIIRKMPVVSIDGIEEINVRDKILSEDKIGLILNIYQNLSSKLGVIPKLFKIENPDGRMDVATQDEWKIYFMLNEPINEQLENLKVILEKVGDGRNLLEYINLRFGDKVYYKMQE